MFKLIIIVIILNHEWLVRNIEHIAKTIKIILIRTHPFYIQATRHPGAVKNLYTSGMYPKGTKHKLITIFNYYVTW